MSTDSSDTATQEVPLWTTIHGDKIRKEGDIWVFHEKPSGDDGLEKNDPVPEQLYKGATPHNQAAKTLDTARKIEAMAEFPGG